MQNFETAIKKLSNGELKHLTPEEKNYLIENLESDDLAEFSDLIGEFDKTNLELEPSEALKKNLLYHFNLEKRSNTEEFEAKVLSPLKFKFLKFSAAAIVVIASSIALYLVNSSSANSSSELINPDDFNRYTRLEEQVIDNDTLVRETKYLMSMDFFSNASVALDFE